MKVDITKKKTMRKHPLLFNYQRGATKSSENFLDSSKCCQDERFLTRKKHLFQLILFLGDLCNCFGVVKLQPVSNFYLVWTLRFLTTIFYPFGQSFCYLLLCHYPCMNILVLCTQVLDVYTGSNGLIHDGNLLRPMLFIDSSTIDPQTSRRLSVAVSNCGLKQRKGNSNSPSLFFWVANISLKRRKMKIQH